MSKNSYPTNDKPCAKCGSTRRGKPRKRRSLGDCLDCLTLNSRKYRENNKDKVKQAWDNWENNNKDKVIKGNRTKIRNWIKRNPDKYKAYQKVRYRIRTGELPKPSSCICLDCGIQAEDYHHEDYSKPLDVIPLCKPCHRLRHETKETIISI
jgi:hypothetical protein